VISTSLAGFLTYLFSRDAIKDYSGVTAPEWFPLLHGRFTGFPIYCLPVLRASIEVSCTYFDMCDSCV